MRFCNILSGLFFFKNVLPDTFLYIIKFVLYEYVIHCINKVDFSFVYLLASSWETDSINLKDFIYLIRPILSKYFHLFLTANFKSINSKQPCLMMDKRLESTEFIIGFFLQFEIVICHMYFINQLGFLEFWNPEYYIIIFLFITFYWESEFLIGQ